MKKLEEYNLNDIREAFRGRAWVFVPVTAEGAGVALGVAVANQRGYSPVPATWCNASDFDQMYDYTDELNEKLGYAPEAAMRIIASTMVRDAA